MNRMQEIDRITLYCNDEPCESCFTVSASNIYNAEQSMARIKQVMQAILTVPLSLWEEDKEAEWEPFLPTWFVASMKKYSLQELLQMRNQWDFESWVAAILDRAWEWWSSSRNGSRIKINFYTYAYPFNIEPFLFVIRECCGVDSEIHYTLP